jgi:predicted nucleic acid-binding protein
MSLSVLIDSSVLLHWLQNQTVPPAGEEEFFLSLMSADELLRAVDWAKTAHERTRRLAWVEAVLEVFPVLPIDRTTMRIHAGIIRSFETRSLSIGLHESWIAATCVTHGLTLVTLQPEVFQQVQGLQTRAASF